MYGQKTYNPGIQYYNPQMTLLPSYRLYGDASEGYGHVNTAGERAQAFINWVNVASQRTAGGSYVGTNDLVEFVQQVHQMNIDVARQVLKYTTTPGIVYTIYQAGGSTKQQIETRMQTDPEFKQKVEQVTKKVLSTGEDIWESILGPLKGISKTISWMPYIIIGALGLAAYFIFTNPGTIRSPKKVSVF